MKTLKLIALLICGACMMSFTTKPATIAGTGLSKSVTDVQWKTTSVELGNIPQGKPVTIEFEFTNPGKDAVIITDVHVGCGCTVADYPKEPIAGGKSATIKATYNAAAMGFFSKTVTVSIKGEDPKVLTFTGTVI